MVSNHLSYLDIVIISSVMPCFFVSKSEIQRWPYFGEAARSGGTIFIDRKSRASTADVVAQIGQRLTLPIPVLLFPEGTSSDGAQVLRFHSSLFEPAVAAGACITTAAVRYGLEAGRQERDLCWFDDTAFLASSLEDARGGGILRRGDIRRAAPVPRPAHGGGCHTR